MKNLQLPIIENTDERIQTLFSDDDAAIDAILKEEERIIDTWLNTIQSESFNAIQTGNNERFIILSDFNGQIRISYFSIEHNKLYANMHENYKNLRDAVKKLISYSNGNVILN